MTDISVTGGEQLAKLAADLKKAGDRRISRNLRKRLRAAVEPMRAEVAARIEAIPAAGRKETGLRGQMTAALKLQVGLYGGYVRLRMNPRSMPAGKENLPVKFEGPGVFKHPVFGNRAVWVKQAAHPYFAPIVDPQVPRVRAAVMAVIDETIAIVEKGA